MPAMAAAQEVIWKRPEKKINSFTFASNTTRWSSPTCSLGRAGRGGEPGGRVGDKHGGASGSSHLYNVLNILSHFQSQLVLK